MTGISVLQPLLRKACLPTLELVGRCHPVTAQVALQPTALGRIKILAATVVMRATMRVLALAVVALAVPEEQAAMAALIL